MWAASHHVERDVTSYVSTTAGGAVSRNAPSTVQNRYYCTFSTCEPWAAMLASISTSLPWIHSTASAAREGSLGQAAPRAGGAENRPRNWRERIQIKKGETPWLASAGTTVPAGAPLSFRFQVVLHNNVRPAAR